jgi:hypothetical protein
MQARFASNPLGKHKEFYCPILTGDFCYLIELGSEQSTIEFCKVLESRGLDLIWEAQEQSDWSPC